MHITWHGAQINFGDLPPYLTYAPDLAEALDDDGVKAGIGAHALEEQRLALDAEFDAAQQTAGRAARVPLLGVEQEPILVLKLLLSDVPNKYCIIIGKSKENL